MARRAVVAGSVDAESLATNRKRLDGPAGFDVTKPTPVPQFSASAFKGDTAKERAAGATFGFFGVHPSTQKKSPLLLAPQKSPKSPKAVWERQGPLKCAQNFAEESRLREGGLEPPRLAAPDPKSGASANSATLAN